MTTLKAGRIALQVLILALLGACAGGGGGGGGGGPLSPPTGTPRPPPMAIPPLPPPATPGTFPASNSQEFLNNWGVGGTGAFSPWQVQNGHGEGVTVAVIDSGLEVNHPEFAGRVSPDSTDIRCPSRCQLQGPDTHGSEVADLIVGNFNGSQTVGVAFDATLLAIRTDDGNENFADTDIANALDYARVHGARVVNLSLGSTSTPSLFLQQAIQRATNAGMILVFSAGNDGPNATEPLYPGRFATNTSISNGLIVIVGGLNQDGTFNTVSNPAGASANYYLVAPGWQIVFPDFGPPGPLAGFQSCYPNPNNCTGLVQGQGTSYAAPEAAGAVALLISAFPGLTPQQVVTILLQSTDDMGISGIDSQTGWGRLNLARAFAPFAPMSVPLAAGQVTIVPSTTLGTIGAPFGDGMTRDQSWSMTGFDSFGRPFRVDLDRNWAHERAGPSLLAYAPQLWRRDHTAEGLSVALAEHDSLAPESYRLPTDRADLERPAMRLEAEIAPGLTMAFAANSGGSIIDEPTPDSAGHLGFVNSDMSLRLTRRLGPLASFSFESESGESAVGLMQSASTRNATAARLSLGGNLLGLDVTYGRISDEHGLLGLDWSSDFGQTPGSEVRFAGLGGHFVPLPGWTVSFEAETGVADFRRQSWLTLAAPIRTSAFAAEADYAMTPGWLRDLGGSGAVTFSITQPLRVEDGAFQALFPTSDAYGLMHLRYELHTIDATPTGRELRFGLGYRYVADDWLTAFGEAMYVIEPGHVADADPESMARVGLRLSY